MSDGSRPLAVIPDESLPPGRMVELPGRGSLYVRDVPGPLGAPTLVLLHGLLATADLNWSACYGALDGHYRVVALDHRGHGRGISSRRRFRLEDCADDVVALADVLAIPTFIPVGYSMGGLIAQLVWRRHRNRVRGLVLCATSRNFRGHPLEQLGFILLAGINLAVRTVPLAARRRLVEWALARRLNDSPEAQWAWSEFRRNDPLKMVEAARAVAHYSSDSWIGEVDVPTAVVVTRLDRLVPSRRQQKLAAAIRDATVHEVDGDHPVAVRDPIRFTPVLLEACLDVARRSHASMGAPAAEPADVTD